MKYLPSVNDMLILLLWALTGGANALWEYSVFCPPVWNRPDPQQGTQCDLVLLPIDTPATVMISTANGSDVLLVNKETRWTAENLAIDSGIEPKGIIISSDAPISVTLAYIDLAYFNPQIFQDATGIKPVSSSQTSFHITNQASFPDYYCWSETRINQFFGISASEDNTVVTLVSHLDTFSISLNLHETYTVIENDTLDELHYQIQSSAPVTVVSGNICTYNYVDELSFEGTYISTQRPVEQYSTEYIVPSIKTTQNPGYELHVVASMDNTTVNVDGDNFALDKGEVFIEKFPGRSSTPMLVTCSLPCNVVQFTLGYYNNDGMFMMSVTPTEEFYTGAVFTTSEDNNPYHITVITDSPTPVNDTTLDGETFTPEWMVYGDYTYAMADVSQGYHQMMSSQSRFVVYNYAHTGYLSGGYGFAVPPSGDTNTK